MKKAQIPFWITSIIGVATIIMIGLILLVVVLMARNAQEQKNIHFQGYDMQLILDSYLQAPVTLSQEYRPYAARTITYAELLRLHVTGNYGNNRYLTMKTIEYFNPISDDVMLALYPYDNKENKYILSSGIAASGYKSTLMKSEGFKKHCKKPQLPKNELQLDLQTQSYQDDDCLYLSAYTVIPGELGQGHIVVMIIINGKERT